MQACQLLAYFFPQHPHGTVTIDTSKHREKTRVDVRQLAVRFFIAPEVGVRPCVFDRGFRGYIYYNSGRQRSVLTTANRDTRRRSLVDTACRCSWEIPREPPN